MLNPRLEVEIRRYLGAESSFDDLSNLAHELLAEDMETGEDRGAIDAVHLIADLDAGARSEADLRPLLEGLLPRVSTRQVLLGSTPPPKTGTSITAPLCATM